MSNPHTKRNIAEPTVGLIIKENSPDMCVHWLDDLTTWEREENLIVISGVEIIGKKKNKPVYELLSDEHRSDVKVYASNGSSTYSPKEIEEDVKTIIDLGFDSYKMRIGYQDLETDIKRVEIARKTLGDKNLMIDSIMGTINPAWKLTDAINVEDKLIEYNGF